VSLSAHSNVPDDTPKTEDLKTTYSSTKTELYRAHTSELTVGFAKKFARLLRLDAFSVAPIDPISTIKDQRYISSFCYRNDV
jgi:hypothetical protein